jgi:hypothetical protein
MKFIAALAHAKIWGSCNYTLMPLLRNRIVSENMVEEILSRTTMHHCQLAYQKGEFDGINCVLSDFVFVEKPRVTKPFFSHVAF